MLQTLAYSFIALFVILDPVGTTALFAAFTRGMDERQKRAIALRAVRIAGATLLLFAFAGDLLLKALGIGIPALRIAGGILLFLIAIDMLFARQLGIRYGRVALQAGLELVEVLQPAMAHKFLAQSRHHAAIVDVAARACFEITGRQKCESVMDHYFTGPSSLS